MRRVEAINLVPVVFYGIKTINNDWSSFIDAVTINQDKKVQLKNSKDPYMDLLTSVAENLGHEFSDKDLYRGYNLLLSGENIEEEAFIRNRLGQLFNDKNPLPIAPERFPPAPHPPALASLGALSMRN